MSAKYTFLAWDTPVANPPLKLALLQLANNADDDGFSYYSISKMAIACGMSDRTFMRKIAELESLKILTVERRANRPSLYTLVGDEMGVSLCHLQTVEVTEGHAEVTESHLVGDSLSHDPNSAPKSNPERIREPEINHSKVKDIFNKYFCKGVDPISRETLLSSEIKQLTPKRKKLIDSFFKQTKLTIEKFEYYIDYVSTDQNWLYLRKKSGKYSQRPFEYYMKLDCYVKASEEKANNE